MKNKTVFILILLIIGLAVYNIACLDIDDSLERSVKLHSNDSLTRENIIKEFDDITKSVTKKYAYHFYVSSYELRKIIATLMVLETSTNINGKSVPLSSSTSFDEYLNYKDAVKEWFDHLLTAEVEGNIDGAIIKELRYKKVLKAANPQEFFIELQNAGYAEDKMFAIKCANIYNTIEL